MPTESMYDRIPEELKLLNQFVTWRLEPSERNNPQSRPTKRPYNPATGELASSTEPKDWVSFQYARNTALAHPDWYSGIGFVLTEADPYCFIDLDDTTKLLVTLTEGTPEYEAELENSKKRFEVQSRIFESFTTYAELSPSGKGCHLILRGSVPSGRNRQGVELYSSARFMTMTGNWVNGRNLPIATDKQDLIDTLWQELGGRERLAPNFAGDHPAEHSDEQVYKFCCNSTNSELFNDLWAGNWQKYQQYPSQSEADLGLCNMLAVYTFNREQMVRLFHMSGLGQRDKAYREHYLLHPGYGIISKALENKVFPVNFDGLNWPGKPTVIEQPPAVEWDEDDEQEASTSKYKIACPPGRMGEIATFLYNQAYMPVAEYASSGSIFVGSSICGRAYNINKQGLNQYIVNVGITGTGKDGPSKGIQALKNAVMARLPSFDMFFGPGDFASVQGLYQTLAYNASFGSVMGEVTEWLENLLSKRANPTLAAVKRALLVLYMESGRDGTTPGSAYSKKQNSIPAIKSPNLNILGDTTPDSFFKNVTDENISSGLFSRFTIVEYYGGRGTVNENHAAHLPPMDLINHLAQIGNDCHIRNLNHQIKDINIDPIADRMLKEFNNECAVKVNNVTDESRRQLWNRTHIRALRAAGTMAALDNPNFPCVTPEQASWAIDFMTHTTQNLIDRLNNHTLGESYRSEDGQYLLILKTARYWLKQSWIELVQYRVGTPKMHHARVIPHSYFMKKLQSAKAFKDDRMGATFAINRCINQAVTAGDLTRLSPEEMMQAHKASGVAYRYTALTGKDVA